MGLEGAKKALAAAVSKATKTLTRPFPMNVNTKNNAVKTVDLRIDLHKNPKEEGKVTAVIQANTQAEDQGVKDFIKKGNTGGSGSHKGTHKVLATIEYEQDKFDESDFVKKITDA